MTPDYYNIAVAEIGQREIEGPTSNPRILEYQTASGYNAKQDDVPWCASFVSWVFAQAKIPYNKATSAEAASWATWGKPVKTPAVGTVIVFPHHVGFFAGWIDQKAGSFRLLSGNSGGAAAGGGEVRISTYQDMKNVIAMRVPEGMSTPAVTKNILNTPVVKGTGVIIGATAAAVSDNSDAIQTGLDKAQQKLTQGHFLGAVAAIVILVALGYTIYAVVHKNLVDKKLALPPVNKSPG